MSWWKRLWGGGEILSSPERLNDVHLDMHGWSEEVASQGRAWHDSQGNVLGLDIPKTPLRLPDFTDEVAIQVWSRRLAESRHAGLIEVRVVAGIVGVALGLIHKRLQKPAYIFTGHLLVPGEEFFQAWTVIAGERGTTGVREAVITAELMNNGELTIEDYERSWAQDPYDATYRGVDRSVLRFVSDDERYDERFPDHPLSTVRRVLAALPSSVQVESTFREM